MVIVSPPFDSNGDGSAGARRSAQRGSTLAWAPDVVQAGRALRRALATEMLRGRMAWIYVAVAGLLEIVWAFAMKQSDGFTRPTASVVTIVTMIASFALLSLSMRSTPARHRVHRLDRHRRGRRVRRRRRRARRTPNPLRVLAAALIVSGLLTMKLASPD